MCWGEPRPLRTCSECVPVPSAASRGCSTSRRQGLKRRYGGASGGCYPRNPRAQLLKSPHTWRGFEKGGRGSHFPTWLAGLRSAGEAQLQGQRLRPALVLGCRGRVRGGGEGCSVLPLCFQLWYLCCWLCCCQGNPRVVIKQ